MSENGILLKALVVRVNLGKHSTIVRPFGVFVVDFTIVEEKTTLLNNDEAAKILLTSRINFVKGIWVTMFLLAALSSLFGLLHFLPSSGTYAGQDEDKRLSLVCCIAAGPLWAGCIVLNWLSKKLKKGEVYIENLSKKRLSFFRRKALEKIAEQYGCSFGWPAMEIDDAIMGESSYHAKLGKYGLLDPEEFAKETRWVVDPQDSRRYYHKHYDRNHPKNPFIPGT